MFDKPSRQRWFSLDEARTKEKIKHSPRASMLGTSS